MNTKSKSSHWNFYLTIPVFLLLLTNNFVRAKDDYQSGLNRISKKGRYGVINVDITYNNGKPKYTITPVIEPIYDTVVLFKEKYSKAYEIPIALCYQNKKGALFFIKNSVPFQLSEFELDSVTYYSSKEDEVLLWIYKNGKTKWTTAYFDKTTQKAALRGPEEYYDEFVFNKMGIFFKKNGLWGMTNQYQRTLNVPAEYNSYEIVTESVINSFASDIIIYFDRPGKKHMITSYANYDSEVIEVDSMWNLQPPGHLKRKIGDNIEEFILGQWVPKNTDIVNRIEGYSVFSNNRKYGIRKISGEITPANFTNYNILSGGVRKEKNFVLLTNDSLICIFDCQKGILNNYTKEVKEYQIKKNNILFKKGDNRWYFYNREGYLENEGYDRFDMEEYFVALYKDESDITAATYVDLISNTRESLKLPKGASVFKHDSKNNFTIIFQNGKFGLQTIFANIPPIFDFIEPYTFTTPSFAFQFNGKRYNADLSSIKQNDIFAIIIGAQSCSNPNCKDGILGYRTEIKGGEPYHYEKLEVKTWATYKVYVSGKRPEYKINHAIECDDPIHKTVRKHLVFIGDTFFEK